MKTWGHFSASFEDCKPSKARFYRSKILVKINVIWPHTIGINVCEIVYCCSCLPLFAIWFFFGMKHGPLRQRRLAYISPWHQGTFSQTELLLPPGLNGWLKWRWHPQMWSEEHTPKWEHLLDLPVELKKISVTILLLLGNHASFLVYKRVKDQLWLLLLGNALGKEQQHSGHHSTQFSKTLNFHLLTSQYSCELVNSEKNSMDHVISSVTIRPVCYVLIPPEYSLSWLSKE